MALQAIRPDLARPETFDNPEHNGRNRDEQEEHAKQEADEDEQDDDDFVNPTQYPDDDYILNPTTPAFPPLYTCTVLDVGKLNLPKSIFTGGETNVLLRDEYVDMISSMKDGQSLVIVGPDTGRSIYASLYYPADDASRKTLLYLRPPCPTAASTEADVSSGRGWRGSLLWPPRCHFIRAAGSNILGRRLESNNLSPRPPYRGYRAELELDESAPVNSHLLQFKSERRYLMA